MHNLIQRDESQSQRVLFHLKTWDAVGWGKTPLSLETCFLKVELTLILHGFLNMRLSCARRECNGDRCHSRICDKYMHSVWTAWFQFWCKQHLLRIDVLFFYNILNEQRSSGSSSGFRWIINKNIKMQRHLLHHYFMRFVCNVFAFECGFLF